MHARINADGRPVEACTAPAQPRLRILWLSHFVPFPPKGGCFQRSYNLIRRAGEAHDVHLIAMKHKESTHPEEETRRAQEELLKHCRSVQLVDISDSTKPLALARHALSSLMSPSPLTVSLFRSKEMRTRVESTLQACAFDVVHLDTISLGEYLPSCHGLPVLMTHHGAESHMIRRRIQHEPHWGRKLFFFQEWLKLARYERRVCPQVDVNVVMSEHDRALMQQVAPAARYSVVGNGVDVDYFTPGEESPTKNLIFAGRLDQYSNRDAILFFVREVWPLLVQQHPTASIHIIGSNPPELLREVAARDDRVRVVGFVPDVRPYFRDAAVVVCPIRNGGGTRIKILDSLAVGVPIVATRVSCEGIDVVPERDLLFADRPHEFVTQIGRIFTDADLRQRLRLNARSLAEREYSWDVLAAKLLAEYARLAG